MTRIATGPLARAIIVEKPSVDLDRYLQEAGVDVLRLNETPNEDQLIEAMRTHRSQAIFKRSRVPVSRRVIESCPDLLAVQLCCIGDDSVDKVACAEHGIMVFNDPVSNGRSVVELVIGSMISLSRRLYETNVECRRGIWSKNNIDRFEVLGKNICILGLGNIGRGVARAASALGMVVHFFDTRQVSIELGKEMGWKHIDSLDDLFRCADFLTVHLSARDIQGITNEGILTRRHFEQFGADRPGGPRVFVNFSRGFLHEPHALIDAIQAGYIKKAAVDVYPKEPRRGQLDWSNPYEGCEEVVVFPHIGASTQEAQPRIARRASETFLAFSESGAVRDSPFQARLSLGLNEGAKRGETLLLVCHSTARGTKRAIDEAIYDAGASNIASVHKDFNDLGVAYDLAKLDRPLSDSDMRLLIERASQLTGIDNAIRSIRQIIVD